jgi:hypothetical protein
MEVEILGSETEPKVVSLGPGIGEAEATLKLSVLTVEGKKALKIEVTGGALPDSGAKFTQGYLWWKKQGETTDKAVTHFEVPGKMFPYTGSNIYGESNITFTPSLQWGNWKILFDIQAPYKVTDSSGRVTYGGGLLLTPDVLAIYFNLG